MVFVQPGVHQTSCTVKPVHAFDPPFGQGEFGNSKPGLQSRALCGIMCALSIANSTLLLNWPIVSQLILFYFILFSNVFCILVHDYTLCFIGSPWCNVSYYNYNSIQPYYIVIHFSRLETHYQNYYDHREIKCNDEDIKIKIMGVAHSVANRSWSLFWKVILKT